MINPKITVLMAVHNEELHLAEAISSILNQTFKDFELIIINDASTDSSQKILNSFTDKRIKIITNKQNMGLTKSLNKGIRLAVGKYIARMDGDDIAQPERLTKQIAFLNTHPNHGAVSTRYILINDNGQFIKKKNIPLNHETIMQYLYVYNPICHPSAMIRKECFEKLGLYNENYIVSQDYDLWFRVSSEYKLANLPDYLIFVRYDDENRLGAKKTKKQTKLANDIRSYYIEKHLLKEPQGALKLKQSLSVWPADNLLFYYFKKNYKNKYPFIYFELLVKRMAYKPYFFARNYIKRIFYYYKNRFSNSIRIKFK